jgi:hypothetical protein
MPNQLMQWHTNIFKTMKYQQSREPAGCGHGILSIFFTSGTFWRWALVL